MRIPIINPIFSLPLGSKHAGQTCDIKGSGFINSGSTFQGRRCVWDLLAGAAAEQVALVGYVKLSLVRHAAYPA